METTVISAPDIVRALLDLARTLNAVAYTAGNVSVGGSLTVGTTLKTGGYLVANLPAGVAFMSTYVTNASAPAFGSVVVGGGAVTVPVFYDGTNWIVG
jgi:hypothetical protein